LSTGASSVSRTSATGSTRIRAIGSQVLYTVRSTIRCGVSRCPIFLPACCPACCPACRGTCHAGPCCVSSAWEAGGVHVLDLRCRMTHVLLRKRLSRVVPPGGTGHHAQLSCPHQHLPIRRPKQGNRSRGRGQAHGPRAVERADSR